MVLERLRRVTTDNRWIAEIDGLRFVAIISVVMFHILVELTTRTGRAFPIEPRYAAIFAAIGNGDRGVKLFFIISGFVLALPFARHFLAGARPVSLRKYFLRRVTRLEPPYILSIVIFVALLSAYTHQLSADFLRHAMATAVYLHGLIYSQMTPVNPVSWSLEIEIQFYILAPLLMQIYRLSNVSVRRGLLGALILAISLAQTYMGTPQWALWTILSFAQFFLMGLLIADFYIASGERIRPSFFWDVAGVVGLTLSFGLPKGIVADNVLMPWAMVGIFAAALRGRLLRAFFANPWIAVIGGMCYSIYLLHFGLMAAIFKSTRKCIVPGFDSLGNYAIQLVVTGVPVMILSVVFFVLVERPCMDPAWPSKLWKKITSRRRAEELTLDRTAISD